MPRKIVKGKQYISVGELASECGVNREDMLGRIREISVPTLHINGRGYVDEGEYDKRNAEFTYPSLR